VSGPARTVGIVHDERYFWHRSYIDYGPYFEFGPQLESPEPRRRMLNLLDRTGLLAQCRRLPAEPLEREGLLRLHTADYLDRFARESASGGGDAGDFAPFGRGSYEIACLSAGGALAALRAVVGGEVDVSFALVRPPGHHAEADRGRGYCLLANIPLAIEEIRATTGVRRVAVVDWDVHHGNGTQWLFYDNPDVLAISLHQDGLYPEDSGTVEETGRDDGIGANVNVPLPAGSGRGAYMYAFDRVVEPALRAFGPDLIVVACGFDAAVYDPNGRMMPTATAFAELTERLISTAGELCVGRLAVIQEGGYSEIYSPFCGTSTIAALLGTESPAGDFASADDEAAQALTPWQRDAVDAAERSALAATIGA
jgi:acetoin utilization deacetylase AcuC-like enzyme